MKAVESTKPPIRIAVRLVILLDFDAVRRDARTHNLQEQLALRAGGEARLRCSSEVHTNVNTYLLCYLPVFMVTVLPLRFSSDFLVDFLVLLLYRVILGGEPLWRRHYMIEKVRDWPYSNGDTSNPITNLSSIPTPSVFRQYRIAPHTLVDPPLNLHVLFARSPRGSARLVLVDNDCLLWDPKSPLGIEARFLTNDWLPSVDHRIHRRHVAVLNVGDSISRRIIMSFS
ncbi:hypothetical protein BD410DRAFT_316478 [Rickenella mellea]|uniref:Uncharacterized protein n=1 Tax=Rickenella mellea TaxID=50990 RepID=A0A4Y7Q1F7_9AGAM|nr:hypothetical protein BD410DRAFT_316478 [Rickenella mellea]